jgi:hypothetical protein
VSSRSAAPTLPEPTMFPLSFRALRPMTARTSLGPALFSLPHTQTSLLRPGLSGLTIHHGHYPYRAMSSASPLKSLAFPVEPINRTSSPYPDPAQLGPKSQLLAAGTSNYHSTSLRNSRCILAVVAMPHVFRVLFR